VVLKTKALNSKKAKKKIPKYYAQSAVNTQKTHPHIHENKKKEYDFLTAKFDF